MGMIGRPREYRKPREIREEGNLGAHVAIGLCVTDLTLLPINIGAKSRQVAALGHA